MKVGTRIQVTKDGMIGHLGTIRAIDKRATTNTVSGRRDRKKTWYYIQLDSIKGIESLLAITLLANIDESSIWLPADQVAPWHPQHVRKLK